MDISTLENSSILTGMCIKPALYLHQKSADVVY